jgi:hypothetical protein
VIVTALFGSNKGFVAKVLPNKKPQALVKKELRVSLSIPRHMSGSGGIY